MQLAKLRRLVEYSGSLYDWRKVEAPLNALPQFITDIDGLDIMQLGWAGHLDRTPQPFRAYPRDLNGDVATLMAVSQRPISGAGLTEKATIAGWKTLRSWYLVCEQDNALSPDAQRFMAKRSGAVTQSVKGSHVAFISRPEVATALILKAVAG